MKFPPKKVILVTGANGQLGKEFRELSKAFEEFEFLFSTRETLDITDQAQVYNAVSKFRPDYIINCAAYTAVDKAETESDLAFLINSSAVGHLSMACRLYGGKLIHFSTDYVYDSVTDSPLKETDLCQPQSVYGKSKRAGETVLENSEIDWINLRVSWLYSSFNHNFVKTMIRLGSEKEELSIVNDQVGAPTYARDLASAVMTIINIESGSVWKQHYNYSNQGQTNWADFAKEIFAQSNINCKVKTTTTAAYNAPAHRPLWSVLSKKKLTDTFDINLNDWQKSLSACLSLVRT